MAISKWLCTNSTKNMVVKIVHPGGHKELHDRPVLASEIMHRNPKCVVAYPHVFQQPWAIVAPDTVLALGQKVYIVPTSTIRKLQRHALRRSPGSLRNNRISEKTESDESLEKDHNSEAKDSGNREGCLSNDNCFMSMFNGIKIRGNKGDISSVATESSSSFGSNSNRKRLADKRNKDLIITGSSPNRSFTSSDHWQPELDSICEE